MKKIIIIISLAVTLVSIISTNKISYVKAENNSSEIIENKENITELKVVTKQLNMYRGERYRIKYNVNNTDAKVSFKSENNEIATVTDDGLVEAFKSGETNIIVNVGNKSDKCKVVVKFTSNVVKEDKYYVNVHFREDLKNTEAYQNCIKAGVVEGMDEMEAVKLIIKWIANNINSSSTTIYTETFMSMTNTVCIQSGIIGDNVNHNYHWNEFKVSGKYYFTDIYKYKTTGNEAYFISELLWNGYKANLQ